MHLIAYQSDFNTASGKVAHVLSDIVGIAKIENVKHHITGVLFFTGGRFLQIIEGEELYLRSLMRNIEADKRHANIQYLIDIEVKERGFQKWNMDSFNLDASNILDGSTLRELTEHFKQNLLPRSDMLAFYYKALLNKQVA